MKRRKESTIVRVRNALVRAAAALAPSLGAAFIERLWFTVPADRGGSTGVQQEQSNPAGEPFVLAVGGRRVRGSIWGQGSSEGPIVYLLHGWGGRSAQLAAFVPPLLAAGHKVIAFDALSHGSSDHGVHGRRRTTVSEVAEVLAAVVAAHGPAHAIVAHSGGCTSTALALRAGLTADRIAFIAPMADPRPLLTGFVAMLGFGPRVLARSIRRIERRVGLAMEDVQVPRIASRLAAPPPLLVVHDRDDGEVPWSHGSAIADGWPGATLLTTTGLGHRRLLRDETVVAEIVSFVRAPATKAG